MYYTQNFTFLRGWASYYAVGGTYEFNFKSRLN